MSDAFEEARKVARDQHARDEARDEAWKKWLAETRPQVLQQLDAEFTAKFASVGCNCRIRDAFYLVGDMRILPHSHGGFRIEYSDGDAYKYDVSRAELLLFLAERYERYHRQQSERQLNRENSSVDEKVQSNEAQGNSAKPFGSSQFTGPALRMAGTTISVVFAGQFLMLIGSFLTGLFHSAEGLLLMLLCIPISLFGLLLWAPGYVLSIPLYAFEAFTGLCIAFGPANISGVSEVVTFCK